MSLTAHDLATAIRYRFCKPGSFTMTNTFIQGSPWESDVIRVLKSGYWHEYEIKMSVSDYRADFRKKFCKWKRDSARKHDLYKSDSEIQREKIAGLAYRGVIPKPATFHFVTPAGLLDGVTIPDHCGLIEVIEDDMMVRRATTVKKAPRLKKPTKLSWPQLFNLCLKK